MYDITFKCTYNLIEDEEETQDEISAKLKDARMSDKEKKKLVDAFSKKDGGTVSINGEALDTQPLLIGDSNEEKRLIPTLEEKKQATVNGKFLRLNQD